MPIKAPPPKAEQESQYLPGGPPDPQTIEQFMGINTSTTRPGVDDKQMFWCDGFMPIGPFFLRTLPGKGAALWTAPRSTIAFFDFANIGETPIMVAVLADGSIYQVNTDTGVATEMATIGTITNPSRTAVGIAQYGNIYVIIVAKQLNGYFIWDGTTFYAPGGAAPGGGTMPTSIGGSAVETYSGHIWIADGASIVYSAPGSVYDFTVGNGGGSFTSTDSFLRVQYTQLKQTNGFLYLIGDSSVNYISGVATSGTPPTTTFTNQNADPEVGTPWPATVTVFNRNILFANPFGVQVSYGAAVTKVSEALDGVFNTVANFGSFTPSSAKAIIYGKKVFMVLVPVIDPINNQQVNKLFMWNGKLWWSSQQDIDLIYIQYQEINSVFTSYGTDGLAVYPLFQQPTVGFSKTLQSKLWSSPGGYQFTKASVRLWGLFTFYSLLGLSLVVSVDNETGVANPYNLTLNAPELIWTNNVGDVITWTNNVGDEIVWTGAVGIIVLDPTAVGQQGALTGLTVTTQAADLAIVSLKLQDQMGGYRG